MILELTLAFLMQTETPATTLPNADALESKVKAEGAQATVRNLWSNQPNWEALLKQVESGDQAWLKLATHLKPGTDAGQTETLKIAVSQSIQRQPENFLRIAFAVFGTGVCHDLQIEPTAQQHKRFVTQTDHALNRVNDSSLISQRDQCIRALK